MGHESKDHFGCKLEDCRMKISTITTMTALMMIFMAPVWQAAAQSSLSGEWKVTIEYSKRSSSSPHCAGYLFPDPLVVKAGKVTGILNHSERGPVYLSGEVTADGAFTAKGAGNSVEGMITGKLFKAGGNGT